MPELAVPERANRFVEVELGLSEEAAREEAKRCLQCGLVCYRHDPATATPQVVWGGAKK